MIKCKGNAEINFVEKEVNLHVKQSFDHQPVPLLVIDFPGNERCCLFLGEEKEGYIDTSAARNLMKELASVIASCERGITEGDTSVLECFEVIDNLGRK